MKKKHKPEIKMTEEHSLEELAKELPLNDTSLTANVPEIVNSQGLELDNVKIQIELEKAKLELEELRAKSRALSSRPIDAFEQKIVDKQIATQNENKTIAEKIRTQKEYDNVPVTGKFLNRRAPGNMVKLPYIKYEDDPVKWYEFYDGRTYTIPRGFADQLNEYYHSPQFIQKTGPIEDPNDPGSQIAEVDRSNKKYAFVPVGFDSPRLDYGT